MADTKQGLRMQVGGCFAAGSVDKAGHMLRDVSLLTGDLEALGHGEWIDQKTLDGAMKLLMGRSIPAYITHESAMGGDRLTKEVGQWSGFYLDGNQLRARQFKFFPSFAKNETPLMERLLDLAAEMPDEFGVSIVHAKQLVWVFENGEEMPARRGERPPEGSLYGMPAVRFTAIESADFTKAPATNPAGLYSGLFIDESEKGKMKELQELQSQFDALKGEYSTFKATAEKTATEAETLKAAYAKDRAAFEKNVNDITAERDAYKAKVEEHTAAYTKLQEEKEAADKLIIETKAKLQQAEKMSAYKLGVPAPSFELNENTAITTENAWQAYHSIKDPRERSAFYREHRSTLSQAQRKRAS